MNATPNGLDIMEIKHRLEDMPDVGGVHYLHAWNVCSSSIAFSCHVVVPDQNLSRIDSLAQRIREMLLHRFGIDHPILQFETVPCGVGGIFCGMSCGAPEKPPVSRGVTELASTSPAGPESRQSREAAPSSSPSSASRPADGLGTYAFVGARLLLGGIFIYASVDKILYPAGFAQTIHNYQLLPDILVNITAVVLPWIELFLGLFLILGLWLPGAAVLTNLLLLGGFVLFKTFWGARAGCRM